MRRRGPNPTNLMALCMMNDAEAMLRAVVRNTFGSLNVLREQDVKREEKKKVKRQLGSAMEVEDDEWVCLCGVRCSEYDDSEYDYSDSESESEKEEAMDVEDDEEEEEGEKESVESEYADSDEEEMKAMRQFREEGKQDNARLTNPVHPLAMALRYNAAQCVAYLLDMKKVEEDVTALLSLNPALNVLITEAGGVEKVCDRVFGPESLQKQGRVLLEAVTMVNDVEAFKRYEALLGERGYDVKQLVKSSKAFPSLLEFAMNGQFFNTAEYLIEHFAFRDKEVVSAYTLLASAMTGMNVNLEEEEPRRVRRGSRQKKDYPLTLYSSAVRLIQRIPAGLKDRVLDVLMKQLLESNRSRLVEDVVGASVKESEKSEKESVKGEKSEKESEKESEKDSMRVEKESKESEKDSKENETKPITSLENADSIVQCVIDSMNEAGMRFLIETMGLKSQIMKENPRGYTVIERVMTKYIERSMTRQGVTTAKAEDADREEQRQKAKEEALEKKSEEDKARVHLYRLLQTEPESIAKMLELVLATGNGQKRELISIDEVQKRVKKDAEEVSKRNKGRRGVGRMQEQEAYTYKRNNATGSLEQTDSVVKKEC